MTSDIPENSAGEAECLVYAEEVDLLGSHIECLCGVACFVAMISAIQNRHIQAGTVLLGNLTIQGSIKEPASIVEPLQLILDGGGGAVRALVPLSNKAQCGALPEEERKNWISCFVATSTGRCSRT
jgi:ATP-dependent Lon protease